MAELHRTGQSSSSPPQFIAVVGVKGGVGTTTVAVNLAASLRQCTETSILFLDWDFVGSSAAVFFGVTARHSLQSLLARPGEIDPYQFMQSLTPSPCGVSVLVNGHERWHQRECEQERLDQIVRLAAKTTPLVVTDLGKGAGEEALPVLHHATAVVVVTTPRVDAFIATARLLQYLGSRRVSADRLYLVVNQTSKGDRPVIDLAERHVNRRVDVVVPLDHSRCQDAAERGHPLVLLAPTSAFAAGIERLGELLKGQTTSRCPPPRRSRFSLIRARLTNWITQQ